MFLFKMVLIGITTVLTPQRSKCKIFLFNMVLTGITTVICNIVLAGITKASTPHRAISLLTGPTKQRWEGFHSILLLSTAEVGLQEDSYIYS